MDWAKASGKTLCSDDPWCLVDRGCGAAWGGDKKPYLVSLWAYIRCFCSTATNSDHGQAQLGRSVGLIQRDAEVVFWPSAFWEAWGTDAKQPHIFRIRDVFWPCRLRRHGQTKTIIFLSMCGFLALAPQASNTLLGQKTL